MSDYRTASSAPDRPALRHATALRRAGVAAVAVALVISPLLAACGIVDDDPSFAEGDCVRIEPRALDSDLEAADCEGAVGTFEPTERIYRVDSVIDNTDGGCPGLQGFFPVEFVHEPDGVTYCLVQED